MIISKTPFRVSFLGGGSDMSWYYEENGGAVISAAIQKYMYITAHPFFGQQSYRIKYSSVEDISNIEDIKHPIVKACLKKYPIPEGVEIASIADIPAGTGLGSSSSFTVGLINVLNEYVEKTMPSWQIAESACDIEIKDVLSPIGKQDQYAAAIGGLNIFKFQPNGVVDIEPVRAELSTIEWLEKNLRLYYLGGSRDANKLLKDQSSSDNRDAKRALITKMVDMVNPFKDILEGGDVGSVGPMLDQAWQYKKEISSGISSGDIDTIYNKAVKLGSTGGKLLGAGGNGFLLLCHEDHEYLSGQLGLQTLPFNIDFNGTVVQKLV